MDFTNLKGFMDHAVAEGLIYVILGGEVVVEEAIHSGKRKGKVIFSDGRNDV